MEKKKLYDLVGIACGIILLLVLIISHVQANNSQKLDLPSDAQTLTASADGKVGPVEVEVITSPSEIFKVRVTNHSETDGIGTNAVDAIPNAIVEAQSLAVDSVSGATVTENACSVRSLISFARRRIVQVSSSTVTVSPLALLIRSTSLPAIVLLSSCS